ncbi:AGAP005744-PA-like protein [Anopheles sinensis]|uniref:AGAP005744-PA-like protein n=1 Tax=Anopheles sinensis TaxID=74873 RepID=A0A084WJK8_ANOSI|nr:AGAP005744-PA-like protein [Anopheles sinensis]
MFRFKVCVILLAAFYLPPSEAIKCKDEILINAPTESDRFCVFRDVTWRKGVAEPVFEQPIGPRVAFVDSNLTSIPDSFFAQAPRVETLVANNVHLKQLTIKNGMQQVYAEGNSIEQLIVDGGKSLKELYLSKNPNFKNLESLSPLVGLEKLDLSDTGIESSPETIDFGAFEKMPNLTVLRLANDQLHYVENANRVTLPNLKVLDLQGNPIIPANFEMSIFRDMPKLEELDMHNTLMSELSVSPNIRDDLPALKKINIGGMHLPCRFMRALLDELKLKEIEVVGASATASTKCNIGFQAMDGLCCSNDGWAPPPPPTTLTTTQKPEDGPTPPVLTTTKAPQPGPDTPKPKKDSETGGEGGGSSTVVIVSVIVAIILLIGVGVFVAIYLKRRNEATHKRVPGQESNDNL